MCFPAPMMSFAFLDMIFWKKGFEIDTYKTSKCICSYHTHVVNTRSPKWSKRQDVLSKAGPKRGCSSYLIAIMRKQTSDMCKLALIFVRYDKHPLFGSAFIKIKHSTTRPKQGFFLHKNQFTFFSSIIC